MACDICAAPPDGGWNCAVLEIPVEDRVESVPIRVCGRCAPKLLSGESIRERVKATLRGDELHVK